MKTVSEVADEMRYFADVVRFLMLLTTLVLTGFPRANAQPPIDEHNTRRLASSSEFTLTSSLSTDATVVRDTEFRLDFEDRPRLLAQLQEGLALLKLVQEDRRSLYFGVNRRGVIGLHFRFSSIR